VKQDKALVGCQIFGNSVLITFTLAPESMEDLPFEFNKAISREAYKRNLASAIAIDAHNCIQGPFDLKKAVNSLEKGLSVALEKVVNFDKMDFRVGAAKVIPLDFSIENGIGPGGISVVIVEVDNQKTAYVTIDGNNMVPNLREKILSSIKVLGIDNGEILTTDTHIVNAVVIGKRGYHPIGENIDIPSLIAHINMTVNEALSNLEACEVACCKLEINGVRVIGERQINTLVSIINKGSSRAKKNSLLFPVVGILFALLLNFI
jgi:putative membrane protein